MNLYFILAVSSVLLASCSQILLKKSAMKTYPSFIKEYLNFYVITGYGMLFCSVFLTMLAYKGLSYMSIPVIEAIGFILVPVFSYFIFKEGFTKNKIIGMACILLGVFVYYC